MTGSPDLPDPRDEDVLDLTNNYEGLLKLHEVVPAAEELDLADEVAVARERARLDAHPFITDPDEAVGLVDYRSVTADADLEATDPVAPVPPDETDETDETDAARGEVVPSDGQAQGLVVHLLQATPIPDEDNGSDA